MSTFSTQAIILRRQDFRENDSRISVYSRERGKLSLVVRGTKRSDSKLLAHIEPMTLAEIMVVTGKTFDYLGSAICARSFITIKSDVNSVYWAGKAVKIFDVSVRQGIVDVDLFELLLSYLDILDIGIHSRRHELFFSAFVLNLVSILGHMPDLSCCGQCGKKIEIGGNYFDMDRSAIICPKCATKQTLTISDECVKVLRFFEKENIYECRKIDPNIQSEKEVINFINSYLQYNQEILNGQNFRW